MSVHGRDPSGRPVRYLVGIDTGGTYTDAAVLTAHDHRIVATAKALTTRGDLAVGVGEALGKALGSIADKVLHATTTPLVLIRAQNTSG